MNTIKIQFDTNHNPIPPTFLLSTRYGTILGLINNVSAIHLSDNINDSAALSFQVSKDCSQWEAIDNLKLIYCIEWDTWFQIQVQISDTDSLIKSVDCKHLCEAELSQTNLYSVEINTETDISRDDYKQTYLYVDNDPKASLFDRVLEKTPHYKIVHVDDSIKNIRRIYTFTFDGISVKEALDQIAEEVGCLIVYGERVSEDKYTPVRTISIYDLQQTCKQCGNRGEFRDKCPECGSTDIVEGYGNDTTIFISKDNLTDDITYSVDLDSVKNCFKLQAGDDLMTAVITTCNPNGTEYLWDFAEFQKEDMPEDLVLRIESYDELYQMYKTEYEIVLDSSEYNKLVQKYLSYDEELQEINSTVKGYSNLINAYYDAMDFHFYLETSLMPDIHLQDTSAKEQAALLTSANLSPIAVTNFNIASKATIDSNVLAAAKVLVDSRYKLEIKSSTYVKPNWTGIISLSNYSETETDEEKKDKADSEQITIVINDDYEKYVKQLAERALKKGDTTDYSISGLFKSENFADELKKYSLDMLENIYKCCNGCVTVLQEQGVSAENSQNDVKSIYLDYYDKLQTLEVEISLRESEIDTIKKIEKNIESEIDKIHKALDFQNYIGSDLWNIFIAYRREDLYSNSNYVSDGLTNAELITNANKFIKAASDELYKSSHLQHSISSSLKNLLVIKEFEPLVSYFQLGNWLRIKIDNKIYKLRLIGYEIDFDSLEVLNVEFSDVKQISTGISDVQSILDQASNMATSYGYTQRQAWKGNDSYEVIRNWFSNGLDTTLTHIVNNATGQTQTWDEHGMLFRKLDDVTNEYASTAMKIINSTLVLTTDNWRTTKTALGEFIYQDPETGEYKTGYGINGETVVGSLIMGESLGIYNENNTLKFNKDGLTVTNGINTFAVNPNADSIITVKKGNDNLLSLNTDGDLVIKGSVTATTLNATQQGKIGCWVINSDRMFNNDNLAGYTGVNKYGAGQAFWAGGTDLTGNSAPFRVDHVGHFVATDADIVGNIEATSITAKKEYKIYGDGYLSKDSFTIIENSDNWLKFGYIDKNVSELSAHIQFYKNIYSINMFGSLTIDQNLNVDQQVSANEFKENGISLCNKYAAIAHNHDSVYSSISHNHDTAYSSVNHYHNVLECVDDNSLNPGHALIIHGTYDSNGMLTQDTFYRPSDSYKASHYCYIGAGYCRWDGIYLSSAPNVNSDDRLKEDFKHFDDTNEKVFMALKPGKYRFRNVKPTDRHDRIHYGFYAQDIENVLSQYDLTSDDCAFLCKDNVENHDAYKAYGIDDYIYSLKYEEMIPWNTHMIQKAILHQETQDEYISYLKSEVEQLKKENANLKEQLEAVLIMSKGEQR